MPTLSVHIKIPNPAQRDEIIALIGSHEDVDAVEEHAEDEVSFFLKRTALLQPMPNIFEIVAESYGLEMRTQEIPDENWNSLWEQNFQFVIVDDWCAVRAEFHPPINHTEHQILIHPKMAFGTGHHETTYLMMRLMRQLPWNGARVLDFGCGTGILGILAAKCGAQKVIGVDNTTEAVQNSLENATMNQVNMEVRMGSLEEVRGESFDIILANINRQVLVHYAADLVGPQAPRQALLLSGFMPSDLNIINKSYQKLPLKEEQTRGNWCAQLRHK